MVEQSTVRFTPGPWRISEPRPYGGMIEGADGRVLAQVMAGHAGNARLIAAAPDLLAAAEAVRDYMGLVPGDAIGFVQLDAAIRKARGEVTA